MTSERGGGPRVLVALLGVLLSACHSGGLRATVPTAGQRGTVANIPPSGQWVQIPLPFGSATLRMPSQPQYLPMTTGIEDDGASYRTHIGGQEYGGLQLMLAVSEVEGGIVGAPLDRLEEMRSSLLEGAEERGYGTVMVDGSPGFDIEYVDRENGQVVRARAVVGRNHLYLLMALMPPHLEPAYRVTAISYVESLRLDATDSFGATGDGAYQAGGWRWSMPAECFFAVRFPGAPVAVEGPSPVDGATFVRTYRVVGEGGATFEVRATGYDDGRPAQAVSTLEAEPLSHYALRAGRDTTRQGYTGRSLVYESEGRMRFTLIFGSYAATYEVSVDLPRTASPEMLDARNTFLDSFRML